MRRFGWPLLCLTVCGCGGGSTSSVIPVPPYVVFSTDRHANEEIYRIDSSGLFSERLTNDLGMDHQPAFSQDNTKIVWSSDRFGNDDVFIMDADGTNLQRLTTSPLNDNCARFNNDGTRIVFQRGNGTAREIWVMDADGSNQTRVTNNAFHDNEPSWSPAGKIIFTSSRTGQDQLYVMNADGTGVTQLTTDATAECFQADYNQDGSKIAFILARGGQQRAHVMNANGTGITDLGHGDREFWPRWSPDDAQLVVTAIVAGDEDVYRMNPDGSGFQRLTDEPSTDGHGDW